MEKEGITKISNGSEEDIQVEFIQYDHDNIAKQQLEKNISLKEFVDSQKMNWFRITGFSDSEYITNICSEFGLYSFDIRELLTNPEVIKIVLYEKITFALLTIFVKHEDSIKPQQIAFILGDNFLVSFIEHNPSLNKYLNTYIENNIATIKKKGVDYLFYLMLSTVCFQNNQFVLREEENLISLEERMLEQRTTDDILHFLHFHRLAHMRMKHYTNSFREEYENLFDNDNELINDDTLNYFKNLDDRLRTLSSSIEYYRESIFSLQDLYYNTINTNTNNVMKRLTIISSIFIPLTFLVGVWGMNFKYIPEFEWRYGYLGAWLIFLFLAAIIVFYLKWRKWF